MIRFMVGDREGEVLDAIWKNGKMWKIKDSNYGSFRIVRLFGIVYSFTFDICD